MDKERERDVMRKCREVNRKTNIWLATLRWRRGGREVEKKGMREVRMEIETQMNTRESLLRLVYKFVIKKRRSESSKNTDTKNAKKTATQKTKNIKFPNYIPRFYLQEGDSGTLIHQFWALCAEVCSNDSLR